MDKPRFPNATGMRVAGELCRILKPVCHRLIVAGSLRRRKPTIGDLEILFIGRIEVRPDPQDLFSNLRVDLAEEAIAGMEATGILQRRKNVKGSEMFGPSNKLMLHTATGLPVDLFTATEENWHNYLVCRTGPKDSNAHIAAAAQQLGYKWNPYGRGFTCLSTGTITAMPSEEAVFQFVKLTYLPPEHRS